MRQQTDHLVSYAIEARDFPDKNGRGLFALRKIIKGETLIVFGGRAVTRETLKIQPSKAIHLSLQVGDEIFLLQSGYEDGDCINHSCDANAGFAGQITVVAMRNIEVGEEVCFDYAMTDTSDYDEFECHCEYKLCRGKVTGNDWQIKDLQRKYKGYFAPHVQKMIESFG
jgi:SET domain-containing protein